MRVVVCGRGAADARSSVWAHVTSSLRSHGYEVLAFDPRSPERSGLVRGDLVSSLRKLLVEQKPHLLVHIPTPGDLSPSDIREATAASETLAVALHAGTTFPEAPTRLTEAADHLRDYDLVAVPDRWTAAELAAEGSYRLFCLEPGAHAPSLDDAVPAERRGVVVVSEPDDRGAAIARSMVDAGIDLRLVGRGWADHPDLAPISFDPPSYSELGTILASAALLVELPLPIEQQSLVRLSAWEAAVGQSVFDAACVATPSLTLERPGVTAHFQSGENILTYRRDDDVASLASIVLSDASQLDTIGEAAADVVRSGHRWADRWSELLSPFAQPDDDGEAVVVQPMGAESVLESVSVG